MRSVRATSYMFAIFAAIPERADGHRGVAMVSPDETVLDRARAAWSCGARFIEAKYQGIVWQWSAGCTLCEPGRPCSNCTDT